EFGVHELFYRRAAALETLSRGGDPFPRAAPQGLVIICASQNAFYLRQHQLVSATIIVNLFARKMMGQRGAKFVIWRGLIRSLNDDARTHRVLVSEFRKITGFGSGDQLVAEVAGALARQYAPHRKYAIGIEM